MLFLVSTPIGNLKDLTFRSKEILESVDYILCEDTRHSLKLLNHYAIKKPLVSLHAFNEKQKVDQVVEDLRGGKNVAVISDAGTPGICDPSVFLVKACRQAGLPVIAPVGPCALISAIAAFGAEHPAFQFLGFAPKESKELAPFLQRAIDYEGLSVFYDTPHHIRRTLSLLCQMNYSHVVAIAFEISKIHERIEERLDQEWLALMEGSEVKGEMVILLKGEKKDALQLQEKEVMEALKEAGLSHNDCAKIGSKLLRQPKNQLYKKWL